MHGRLEFVLIGVLTSFLLTMLIIKADGRGVKLLLGVFAFLISFFYSFMPFFLPEYYREHYRQLKTCADEHAVCLQSTNYNCGPAAAVTALARFGILADEGEMAILAYSNWVTGTPTDLLCNAINQKLAGSKFKCEFKSFSDLSEITSFPAIAVVEFGFLVDHYVTLLGRQGDVLIVGDPDGGKKMMKEQEFMQRWRKIAIVFASK
jgi:predicted double-glycine peptidase